MEGWYDVCEGTGLRDEEYFTRRNDSAPIVVAAQLGNIQSVHKLLEAGHDIHSAGVEGETALHMAAALGHIGVVSLLLEAGADPERRDKEGSTPLIHCARFCVSECASNITELMVHAGASTMTTVPEADYSATPLCFAIRYSNAAMAKYLALHTELEYSGSQFRKDHQYMEEVLRLCRLGRNPEKGDAILDILVDSGMRVSKEDVPKALRVGRWPVVERILSATGLDENRICQTPTQLLCGALEDPYLRDYPFAEVAGRFFNHFGADPNDSELREVILTRYDQTDLLEVAIRAGMDLTRIEEKNLGALCHRMGSQECQWVQFILGKRNEQIISRGLQ
ncbi:hypothetical protein PHLCEN_2v4591 [Hermanssonia centrifuga]|uniref:Uncharacterized protein n=1 Tax=Hermanssonia centrifuga TaxID=98765 RepID=A0A2R6PN47_9APHY|nr:hypothetical protein PHLCEN_2v4591 [Hermanssonia centrifuga]